MEERCTGISYNGPGVMSARWIVPHVTSKFNLFDGETSRCSDKAGGHESQKEWGKEIQKPNSDRKTVARQLSEYAYWLKIVLKGRYIVHPQAPNNDPFYQRLIISPSLTLFNKCVDITAPSDTRK